MLQSRSKNQELCISSKIALMGLAVISVSSSLFRTELRIASVAEPVGNGSVSGSYRAASKDIDARDESSRPSGQPNR